MATDLIVYGPFVVPFRLNGRSKFIDTPQTKEFLESIASWGISDKQGCYVFATRASGSFCPWYVGKSAKGIKEECMQLHKLHHYNAALTETKKGTPVMFFVLPPGDLKKVSKSVCDEMETVLIQSALFRNPNLRNIQKTRLPEWGITGVIRSKPGKPTADATKFKKMMRL